MAKTWSTCCSIAGKEESAKNRPSNLPTWGFLLLLTLGITVSIALLIIWVFIFPKPFDMEVEDTTALYYNITADKHLYAMFNFTVGFKNPNRMLYVYYIDLNVTIERDNETLAFKDDFGNIVQPPRNVTFLHGRMKCHGDVSLTSETWKDLQPLPSGEIIVDIRIRTRILLWTRYWQSKRHQIETLCSNAVVHRSNATAPRPKVKRCHVNL